MKFDHPVMKDFAGLTFVDIFSGRHAAQLQSFLPRFKVFQISNVYHLRDMVAD